MTATTKHTITVFVILVLLSIYLPTHTFTQTGDSFHTESTGNDSTGLNPYSNFYIDQNFTVEKGENLTILNQNIVVLSPDLESISLNVYGNLTLENCTLYISGNNVNRATSLNFSVSGSGSTLKVEYSRLNYSGSLYLYGTRAVIMHSVVGENNGSAVSNPKMTIRFMAYKSNVSVIDSRLGGQMILHDPGNFKAASIYGVNYNSQYPDSTPGNMTTRYILNSSIDPKVDLLNLSISYKDLVNETSGVYFYLNTQSGILDNISLPYNLDDGMKTLKMNLNVSSLSEGLSFFLNKSKFWLSKEFNGTDALGIYNLSISLYSNSWVRLIGRNYFSLFSENSSFFFSNSTTDFNENPYTLNDGAQSYRKSFMDIINSTAIFVDTSIQGDEGIYSPVTVMNSTFISASEVNIMAYDMGYPYPVNNISLNPLYNESVSLQFENATRMISRLWTKSLQRIGDNEIIIPYYYCNLGSEYNFTDFNYTADGGILRGFISLEPFPYMPSNATNFTNVVNIPVESATLGSIKLVTSGTSTFKIKFSGNFDLSSPLKVLINVENFSESFNETLSSNIYGISNHTAVIHLNLTGLIPGITYRCSIQSFYGASSGLIEVNSSPIASMAVLNGSIQVTNASFLYVKNGTSFLNATLSLNASRSVQGKVIITDRNLQVMEVNLTFLPGNNQFSFPITNVGKSFNLSIQANAVLLSSNSSYIVPSIIITGNNSQLYNVSFRERGLENTSMWGIMLNGTIHTFYGPEGNVYLGTGKYNLSVVNQPGYISKAAGTIHVGNSSSVFFVNFTEILFRINFINSGGVSKNWEVLIDGSVHVSNQSSMNLSLPMGVYNFEIVDPDGYSAIYNSSLINLTGNVSILIHSERNETPFSGIEKLMGEGKSVIGISLVLIPSIAVLLNRRKHRWKFR